MAVISCVSDSTFAMSGAVSLDDVVSLRSELDTLVKSKSNAELCLDLSGFESVSSVVLSLLLCTLRTAENVSCNLTYANMPSKLFDAVRVGGLDSIIPRSEV